MSSNLPAIPKRESIALARRAGAIEPYVESDVIDGKFRMLEVVDTRASFGALIIYLPEWTRGMVNPYDVVTASGVSGYVMTGQSRWALTASTWRMENTITYAVVEPRIATGHYTLTYLHASELCVVQERKLSVVDFRWYTQHEHNESSGLNDAIRSTNYRP